MSTLRLPWKAWQGDEALALDFPETWSVQSYPMDGGPEISDAELVRMLDDPIGSPPLPMIAKWVKDVAIAVDDTSRPTPIARLLPPVLTRVEAAGVARERIKIIVALGSHAPLSKDELRHKLGEAVASDYHIVQHDATKDLSDIGMDLDGIPVRINSAFYRADLKITMGCITPHPFAGFSGGGKMVLPGLSSIEIIERTHRFVAMGFRGGLGVIEGNRFREDVETVCRRCKLDLIVDSVLNQNREIAGIFAGDFVEAFQKGVDFARGVYRTPLPERVDVALLNAYPKDSDLVQSENAFNLLRSAKHAFLEEEGQVILMSAAGKGAGAHGLFSPGGRLYRKPLPKRWLGKKGLIVFAPEVPEGEGRKLIWEGYPFCRTWEAVLSVLKERYPQNCRVAVFPSSAIQLGAAD